MSGNNYLLLSTLLGLFCPHLVAADVVSDSLPTVALHEVVATGTRNEADARLLPITVSVLTDSVLTERKEINILPTLTEHIPGLFVTQRGVMGYGVSTGGSGGINVRGIGGSPNTDILVLIDGLPQYAGLYGHPIADNYQTMLAERVEVVRGPASMYYGSNAMGGVINIVTRQPKQDTVISNLHLQGGSYYSLDAGISNQVKKGNFVSAVGFNYSRTDGHRPNMNFDEYNGYLKLGYLINSQWQVNAMGNVAYFNSSNPGTVNNPIEDNDMHILRGMAALSVENEYNRDNTNSLLFPTSGAVRAYYNGGRHQIYDGYTLGAIPPATTYFHTDFMAGVSAYQSVAFFQGNRTTFGLDYQYFGGHAWNQTIATHASTDIISKTQYELAAYIDFRQQVVSWFALDVGCRVDMLLKDKQKSTKQLITTNYAPQGGMSFLLPKQAQIKLLVSRGFRNPTIRELYMYKPANEELLPVNMWNYELSYNQSLLNRRLNLSANLFYLHAKNNIETRMVDGKPLNVNTGELKNTGCEVAVNYRIWKGLHLNANYSYLYMVNPTIAAPEHKLNIALLYHHERFRVGTSWQYIHGLWTNIDKTNPLLSTRQNYLLWNANASVRIWKGLWANLNADNLLAQQYEINLGFPMPRTTIMGGLSWTF